MTKSGCKGYTLMEVIVAVVALIVVAVTGLTIYAAWHFVAKFW